MTRVSRAWRVLRTGIGFVSFGLLGLGVGVVVIPWLHLRCRDPEQRLRRVQGAVNQAYRIFMGMVVGMRIGVFRREGVARRLAEPGQLLVANHPTLIDAPAILSCMTQGACITKQSNTSNPTMSGAIRGAGYLPNAGGQAIVDACAESLGQGRSLLLFPEGTRSPKGGLGEFQRGAAHIAMASGRDLLPVFVTCQPPTLMRGQKWYDVPDGPFELTVRVGEPVRVRPYLEALEAGEKRPRVARKLTAELRETFEKALFGVAH